MTFVYPLLLGGLALIGIPVLLHLIMRQKPKRLPFPAMRFLLQRQRTNQRKLQLRHLLLLALRMLLIAGVCLALARPKIFSERLNFSGDRPRAAVLVFDTSPSMEYKSGRTRLEEAKRLGLELLDDLPEGSRVAVFDSADLGDDWLPSLSLARERINALQIRPANRPVTKLLDPAYRLLDKLVREQENPNETPLLFLYVFSDRTRASWDGRQVENLQRLRDRIVPPGVHAVFVDVGVDKPEDLAVVNLELPRQVVSVNGKVEMRATVRGVGRAYDTELLCRIDGEEIGRKPVQLKAGQEPETIVFEQRRLSSGPHQIEVAFRATDAASAFNDVRYATFEVRGNRNVLTLTDRPEDVKIWNLALEARGAFSSEVKSVKDRQDAALGPADLARYQAVCLVNVAKPSRDLWQKLERYVRDGGGLAVVPGGTDMDGVDSKIAYNDEPATQALLPGRFVKIVEAEDKRGAVWNEAGFQHALMAPFREWGQSENVDFLKPGLEPAAFRYWDVEPRDKNEVIVSYKNAAGPTAGRPALLERTFDRSKVRGRVLQYTTPLDDEHIAPRDVRAERWNNYLQSSFYLVFVQKTVGYLAGDAEDGNFNFQCGQIVPLALPATPRFPTYTVQGPGLSGADAVVPRSENDSTLNVTKAFSPGNYAVLGADGKRTACFSLNIAPEETDLAQVPVKTIEDLFGPGSVVPLDYKTNLRDALQNRWSQPVELFPWLMILVLLAFAAENLLSNKFYREEKEEVTG